MTLGYARAQRDLGCVYTLGFYVQEGKEDRNRKLSVRVRRPGVRAIHPSRYVVRSTSEKRQSLLRAAWAAPDMFQTGILRAHVFPLRPSSKSSWDALLAISFPVPLAGSSGRDVHREFGAVLHHGPRLAHRFVRRITLHPDNPGVTSEPVITFLERVDLAPGKYTVTAVLSDPLDVDPHATELEIEVPEIPKRELMLVGPILGRPAGPNLVVMNDGTEDGSAIRGESSFEPLLVRQVDGSSDLVSLTQACMFGSKKKLESAASITRSLRSADGREIGALEPVALSLEGEDRIRCQNLVDLLPGAALPGGDYIFEVDLETGRHGVDTQRTIRFAVGTGVDLIDEFTPTADSD